VSGAAAFLKALTPEARVCLGTELFRIPRFPFRVGRENRTSGLLHFPNSRRRADSLPTSDLYLFVTGPVLNVSRDHFQIELRRGEFFLVDRGSAYGTIVEGETVGEDRTGGERRLNANDVIIVGSSESRYVFKFVIVEPK
jgi:pSer/pThr/pTyr-binding forkhead associated (FHA) protein